jgi:hypothetical protein
MANENVEGSAANTMANSQSGGRSVVKDWIKTVWGNKQLTGGNSSSSSSSSSSGGGGGKGTGNGWTSDDYKNYGDWQQRHYDMQDNIEGSRNIRQDRLEGNRHVRDAETNANNAVLKNSSKDAKLIRKNTLEGNRQARDKDTLEHAAKFGQMRNVDLSTPKKRTTISFDASPVRETNPGKGAGAQGTSKQQTKPGGTRAPRSNVRTIFDPSTKAVTGYSYGGRHDAWDDKLDNRPAVKAGGKKVAPGTTAGEAAAAATPTSGAGAAIGGKVGAVAGAAISKTPTGAALGAKAGEMVGNAIEKKVVNRKPRAKKA